MRPEEVYRSVEAWLGRAAGDLKTAVYAVAQPDLAWVSCSHSQQAAEKALKAYLVWLGEVRIPRIHDLERLGALVLARGGEPVPDRPLKVLNRYMVIRYPEVGDPDSTEARRALDLAREVVSFVRAALGEAKAQE